MISTRATVAIHAPAVTCGAVHSHRREGQACHLASLSSRAASGKRHAVVLRGLCRSGVRTMLPHMDAAFRPTENQRVAMSTAVLTPPEIVDDGPTDLLSTLETPSLIGSYGEAAADVVESPVISSATSDFRWDHQWYAAHALDHMDPAVPHAVTVLGRPMVLWRDASETWRCFLDECPHRRVPLSEGRIDEKGRLACSYHAWSFNGNGSCSCIPQASEGPESRAVNNPRSCCVTFPCKVQSGMLFVWPDETSPDVAATTSPPALPGSDDPDMEFSCHVRDLPYSYELVAENFVDPAHVPVAHHSVGVNKRSQARPVILKLTRYDHSGFEGFTQPQESSVVGATINVTHHFRAPVFVYDIKGEKQGKGFHGITATFMTPTSPGRCRVIVVQALSRHLSRVINFIPKLLGTMHFDLMDLLDSDAVFLHYQEVLMNAKERHSKQSWRDAYFLPTRSDLYVITFHKWLERFAHGGVRYGPGWNLPQSPGGTREELMDRANGHVAHCKICQGVLAKYQMARAVLTLVASICLLLTGGLLGSALLGSHAITTPAAALLLLAAACGASIAFCNGIIQKFIYRGWNHARIP